jgi:hypothetical protein
MGCGKQLVLGVTWCCTGGWVGEEAGSQSGVQKKQSCQGSLALQLDGLLWMDGGLVIGHAKSFRLFEIMFSTEGLMYNFQFFSRRHNLSLLYILFNDSGNLCPFNHFLIRFVHSLSSILSGR